MKWVDELPVDEGATDLEDSARLAGIMVTFGVPGYERIDMSKYFVNGKYVRHPKANKYDLSRDQGVCIMAGLALQGRRDLVSPHFMDGKDYLSPSVWSHIHRCEGSKVRWDEENFFKLDIDYNCKCDPWSEKNQILVMAQIAGPEYIRRFRSLHPDFRKVIKDYWCEGPGAWRGEPEVAAQMIKVIEGA